MSIEFHIDKEEIRGISRGLLNEKEIEKKAKAIVNEVAVFAAGRAKDHAPKSRYDITSPVPSGNLKNSFQVSRVRATGGVYTVSVFSDVEYAAAVESGSGLYGPTGNLIRSKSGKQMILGVQGRRFIRRKNNPEHEDFDPRTGKIKPIRRFKGFPPFASSTKGQKGQGFFRKAAQEADELMRLLIQNFDSEIQERIGAIEQVKINRPAIPRPRTISPPSPKLSSSGKSEILPAGNLPKGTFETRSLKDNIIDRRLSGGQPGGGRFVSRKRRRKR